MNISAYRKSLELPGFFRQAEGLLRKKKPPDTNDSVFTVQEPGIYEVSFHGTLAPASGTTFPLQLLLYLQQQGNEVPGASVRQSFQTSTDVGNVSFSQIINVSSAPETLSVVGNGGNFTYSDVALTVQKVGDAAGTGS